MEEGGGGGGSWYPISSDPRYYKSIKATLLNFSDKIELEWLVFHISDHNTVIMTSYNVKICKSVIFFALLNGSERPNATKHF